MKKLELRVHPVQPGPDESRIIDMPPGGRYKRVAVFRGIELRTVTEREMKDYQKDLGPETLALFLPEADQSFDLYEIETDENGRIILDFPETPPEELAREIAKDEKHRAEAGVGEALRLHLKSLELASRIADLEGRINESVAIMNKFVEVTTKNLPPPKDLLEALNELGRGAVETMRRTRGSRWMNERLDWRTARDKDLDALLESLSLFEAKGFTPTELRTLTEIVRDWRALHRQHEELRSDVDHAVQAVFGVMHADPVKAIRDSGLALRRRLEKAERRLTEGKVFATQDDTMTVGELRGRMLGVPDHLPVIIEVMNAQDNDDLPMGGLVAPDVETRCDGQDASTSRAMRACFPRTKTRRTTMSLMTPEQIADAVVRAGFYVAPALLGTPTLWCHECKRDSGMHWSTCSKSRTETLTAATCRCPEYTTCAVCVAAHQPLTTPKVTLSEVAPSLSAAYRKYLEAEPDGDYATFLSWADDELRPPKKLTLEKETVRSYPHDSEPATYTDGKEPDMPFHTNSMQCGYNPRGTTR